MTASLALAALVSSSTFLPGGLDLLETGLTSLISEIPFLTAQRILIDGEPILLDGPTPAPPWGSFNSLEMENPLEAGIWAGSRWTAGFGTPRVPDSSFVSIVGLMENTRGRNRYSGTLLRPFPGMFRFAGTLAREDTLIQQTLSLSRGPFDLSARLWQESADGSSSWIRYRSGALSARAGYSSTEGGSGLAEGLASGGFSSGMLSAELAAGVAGAESLTSAEAHALVRYGAEGLSAVARLDGARQGSEDIEGGWAAGGSFRSGRLGMTAGAAAAPGEKPSLLLGASAGTYGLEILYSDGELSAGAHASGPLCSAASIGFRADSTRLAGALLPEIGFGASGRLRGGPRVVYVSRGDSDDTLRLDLLGMLAIKRFSFVISAEDITESSTRRYSYGIVWSFEDTREAPSEEGGRDRQ